MKFSLSKSAIAIQLVLASASQVTFSVSADSAVQHLDDIEVITVTNQRHSSITQNQSFAKGKTTSPDLANWLASIPGANINSNGPITGIAQYRGLYGDRVSSTLDGHQVVGAGPNAMDTPLSYSTPLIVESMTVYRGIAPVSAGIDTLGGAIDVKMRKAETMSSDKLSATGDLQAGYRSNNKATTLSAVTNLAKNDVAVMLYGNKQAGDSMESGDGTLIQPTDFDKVQLGGDVRYNNDQSEIGLSYHYTETVDSGTPALPMDIEYIESHRITLDGKFALGEWDANWQVGYFDADHGMTNFLMRYNPNPQKHRRNTALADTTNFKFSVGKDFSFGQLSFGADGYQATHDSVITNPNNPMFEVVNFNNVKDNRYGLFGEWQNQFDATKVQLGVRLKHTQANADEVSSSMAMMSMPGMGMDMSGDMNMGGGMSNDMSGGMNSDMDMGSDMNMDMNDDAMAMPSMGELARDLQDDFNKADRRYQS